MHYFIVTFQAIVDGVTLVPEKLGSDSPSNDHRPNHVKNVAVEYYRKHYPYAKSVAIVILDVQPLDKDNYYKSLKDCINID